MLNGLWTREIADSRGVRARGVVRYRNVSMLSNGEAIDIAGSYEGREGTITATLHVVLAGRGSGDESIAERVHPHAQGQLIGDVITSPAIFPEDGDWRANVHLMSRAATERPHSRLSAGPSHMAEARLARAPVTHRNR